MRLFSKTRLFLAGLALLGLFAVHGPLVLYSTLSSDKEFLPETRIEIEVFRYLLLALAAGLFLATLIWHGLRRSPWYTAIAEDFASYFGNARPVDPLVRHKSFVAIWSGVMLVVFLGLYATIRLSFIYQNKGVCWYDELALEDGIWEMGTAFGLLGAGLVLLWGTFRYRGTLCMRWLWIPLGLGLLLCLAAGEEMSWGQRWLGYSTPEVIKNVNVQGEFTIHNMGGRWANQAMILFFLGYIGFAPLLGTFFVDVRYLFERLNVPLAPLWFAPWAFIGVLFDERDLFSRLWGSPPWCLDEVRETLFGVVMLGVMIHGVISWQKRSIYVKTKKSVDISN